MTIRTFRTRLRGAAALALLPLLARELEAQQPESEPVAAAHA